MYLERDREESAHIAAQRTSSPGERRATLRIAGRHVARISVDHSFACFYPACFEFKASSGSLAFDGVVCCGTAARRVTGRATVTPAARRNQSQKWSFRDI